MITAREVWTLQRLVPHGFEAYGGAIRVVLPDATEHDATEHDAADRTVLRYNDRITLSGIPLAAYEYMLGSRSAIEWIIDRYYVKTDMRPASSTIRATGHARSRIRATSSTCSHGSSPCRWRR